MKRTLETSTEKKILRIWKYNYILIQEELYKKDKIIQDLQKKIELRDLNIKETFSLDKENSINKELDYQYLFCFFRSDLL